MRPFFFGEPANQLLGVHHPPTGPAVREVGIILCYPIGHEYVAAHRAYRVLATRLAGAGFHVLRFDYYGTGDSAGDRSEGNINRWTQDVHAAIDELRVFHGVLRVVVVGLHLGGSLAALVAAQRPGVDGAVLWHPVVHGSRYISTLRLRHAAWLETAVKDYAPIRERDTGLELLGAPMPDLLVQSVQGLELHEMESFSARRVLLLSDAKEGTVSEFGDRLEELGATVDRRHAPPWLMSGDSLDALARLPSASLQSIERWLDGVSF